MKFEVGEKNLILYPEMDLIASQIEKIRDFILEKLKQNPDKSIIILNVKDINIVDSLGVNLIIGLYRQSMSESKIFEVTNAGKAFIKVSNFFRFNTLFKVRAEEDKP